jgi:hypothetical protein
MGHPVAVKLLTGLLFVAPLPILLLLWSSEAQSANCSDLVRLEKQAAELAQRHQQRHDELKTWTDEVAEALRSCADPNVRFDFLRKSDVSDLMARRVRAARPRSDSSKAGASGAGASDAGASDATPSSSQSSRPHHGPVNQDAGRPTDIEIDAGGQTDIELVRERAVGNMRIAVAACGSVANCPPDLKKRAIDSLRDYMRLLLAPATPTQAIAKFADVLSVVGDSVLRTSPDEIDAAMAIANQLSPLGRDSPGIESLSPEVQAVLADPPSPTRNRRLLSVLLDRARLPDARQAFSPNQLDQQHVDAIANTAQSIREIEQRVKKGFIHTILVDTEHVPVTQTVSGQSCPLRDRLQQGAQALLTKPVGAPPVTIRRSTCPAGRCDVALEFHVEHCVHPSDLSLAKDCLRLALAVPGATNEGAAQRPLDQCPDETVVASLVGDAFAGFTKILDVLDKWAVNRAFASKADLRIVDVTSATLPQALRGRGIAIEPSDQKQLVDAIRHAFAEIAYRGTGSASAELRSNQVRLGWTVSDDKAMNVIVFHHSPSGQDDKLLEFRLEAEQLSTVPSELLADRITHRVVRYYENELTPCSPRFASPAWSVLLAGLPHLADCDTSNDSKAVGLAGVDAAAMIGAGVLALSGFAERNQYSSSHSQSDLDVSRGLYIGSFVSLGVSLFAKSLSFAFWGI